MSNQNADKYSTSEKRFRIGVVSFFNARPLIFALEQQKEVLLRPKVPAVLAEAINSGQVDIALAPSIDYQQTPIEWQILPIAAIGSTGEVLTVRLFSQMPLEQIEQVACDTDSHTSVVLLQVIWQLRYQKRLEIVPLTASAGSESAVLLIGDKVLGQLDHWPYEVDLGLAWVELTGLPFVYAFWAVPVGRKVDRLVGILQEAYLRGNRNIDQIVDDYGEKHGFARELGSRYLRENIFFEFGPAQKRGLQRFYELAAEMGLTMFNRPLHFYCCDEMAAAKKPAGVVEIR